MQAILGIGNLGSRYRLNRHNAGFLLLDQFADGSGVNFKSSHGNYFLAEGTFYGSKFSLIKPANYVNNSGIAAKEVVEHYKIGLENLLVICDDVNLDFGELRIRKSGEDGGHNGLRSIIYHLNSNKFPRLRIGVRNKENQIDLVEFVLSDFTKEEILTLKEIFNTASSLLSEFIRGGIKGMLEANSKLRKNK
ncbi:MAG TPA: aminoacyl-tRNA hydrolase [Ignavibacteriaceae bacterium]|nr:aminoacyl-tRNA hydrolase [Ignavibacteriaceae bacterium]